MTRDVMTILSQMRVTQLEELRARHEGMQRSAEDRLREERSVQDEGGDHHQSDADRGTHDNAPGC